MYLVGMPASGKTTLGKSLAKEMGREFVDIDHKIEEFCQMTVGEIITENGMEYFRKIEKDVLDMFLSKTDLVVSTGGGLPCFYDNMEAISNTGFSVFLNVSPSELNRRMKSNMGRSYIYEKAGGAPVRYLTESLKARKSFYKMADIHIRKDDITTEDIIKELEK